MKARNNISIMEPNIYDFAHTEYAQDAFIAWMCSNFHSGNPLKSSIAKKFMEELLSINVPISTVKASTQVKKIDVLLTLNGGEYYVIIEDKKFSSYHNDQLCKYIDELGKEGIKTDQLFVVYYKTGHVAKTPNFIYFVNKDGYKYDVSVKSEYELVNSIEKTRPELEGRVKVCELPQINSFFRKYASDIVNGDSEILENYASSIKRQYDGYISDFVPSKEFANGAKWGKAFDDYISKAQQCYPQLAFKLDLYSGYYWEIYIVSRKECVDTGERPFNAPILNVRGDIFSTEPPKVYFFNSNERFKKNTEFIRRNKKSVTCKLDLSQSDARYKSESVKISDLYELLDAVCREFINFLSSSEEVPFNCKLF